MPKVHRLAGNHIIRLVSAEMGKEIQSNIISKQKQKMAEGLGVQRRIWRIWHFIFKQVVAEDPANFKKP